MANNKKPRRTIRARINSLVQSRIAKATIGNDLPMNHVLNRYRIDKVFEPIEHLLDDIERTGESSAMPDGTVIFQPPGEDGCWYPLAASLISLCDTYALIAAERGIVAQLAGVQRVAKKLDVDMPLFAAELAHARADIVWMRQVVGSMTPNEFSGFIVAIQIRNEMEAS